MISFTKISHDGNNGKILSHKKAFLVEARNILQSSNLHCKIPHSCLWLEHRTLKVAYKFGSQGLVSFKKLYPKKTGYYYTSITHYVCLCCQNRKTKFNLDKIEICSWGTNKSFLYQRPECTTAVNVFVVKSVLYQENRLSKNVIL